MLRFLFIAVLFVLFSCNREVDKISFDELFSKTDTINYVALETNEHLWGKPFTMKYIDSMIFVYDDISSENMFHLIDLNNNNNVISIGKKGQGGNEFIMPMEYLSCCDTAIAVYDYANRRLSTITINDFLYMDNDFFNCHKDTFPNTIKVFETKYKTKLSFGFYDDCMFYLQKDNEVLQKIGDFPYRNQKEKHIENRLKGLAYQGIIQNNPSNDKFVYAINSAEIVYFYHVDSLSVKKVCEYQNSFPLYKPLKDGLARSAPLSTDNIKTFLDVTASDNFVYLLYSGRTFKEAGMKSYEGNIIFVFDWNGKAYKKYILDKPIFRLCVDNEDDIIYAFSNNPDPTLVKFDL